MVSGALRRDSRLCMVPLALLLLAPAPAGAARVERGAASLAVCGNASAEDVRGPIAFDVTVSDEIPAGRHEYYRTWAEKAHKWLGDAIARLEVPQVARS